MSATAGVSCLSTRPRFRLVPDYSQASCSSSAAASAQFRVRRRQRWNGERLPKRPLRCDDNSAGGCISIGSCRSSFAGNSYLQLDVDVWAGQQFGRGGQKQHHKQWKSALGKDSPRDSNGLWEDRRFSVVGAADDDAWLGSATDKGRYVGERMSVAEDSNNGIRDLPFRSTGRNQLDVPNRKGPMPSGGSAPIPRGSEESSRRETDDSSFPRRGTNGLYEETYGGPKRTWGVPGNLDGPVGRGPDRGQQTKRGSLSRSEPNERDVDFSLQQSKLKESVKLELERYLDDGDALLEEGMRGLEGRIEVGVAERMLYEAAKRFESAAALDPSDLGAVGQWGNTLLVHGELKLRLSQKLRRMLPPHISSTSVDERESLEMTLQDVCEECEELLMDAGRKFRKALSLDKKDVRGLYNWGLALSYRAQLIAEEGGERARQDADKVYLAAIDKFEAMLGLSQDYGPGALLNWGIAMRNRARLRTMGDKERVRILIQARDLFEDAVRLDPSYGQARSAVAVCSAELKELQEFEL